MPKFSELAADYKKLWDATQIRPERAGDVVAAANKLKELKATYDEVSAKTSVPWYVVGLIHSLEAGFKMDRHLHNGDGLDARTHRVPAGRPKSGSPPFSWVASAIDALEMKGLHEVGKDNWSIERIAFSLEGYNGFGYRNHHPEVKSPYLWSFTNQYSRGKYVGDHKFDPNAVSDQVGAMAILKQLIADKALDAKTQAQVKPRQPPPPPVPVPTGLFFADKVPFFLREKPDINPKTGLRVLTDMPVRKLEDAAPPWWKVEVMTPDTAKHVGFAQSSWLVPQTVPSSFDPEEFAQTCLDVARRYGTSAHFLLALADVETGMMNTAGPVGTFGPFGFTEDEWKAENDPKETGSGDDGRFDPHAQAAVAARLLVKLTEAARNNLPDKRLATSEELYLARILGPAALPALIDEKGQDKSVRDALAPMPAADIDGLFARRPALLTAGITVKALREAVVKKLEAGFENAVAAILAVEPDLVVGPPETTDDAGEVPWMQNAKAELAKGIKEFKNGSNPEIEKYFTVTTIGKQPDDVAWCGAFVSWCIKQSNGAKKPVTFSARAADWLKNGEAVSGPQYGAIAVLRPLAPKASGHVAFVVSWDETKVNLLGGNQGDSVCEERFKMSDVRGWRMV